MERMKRKEGRESKEKRSQEQKERERVETRMGTLEAIPDQFRSCSSFMGPLLVPGAGHRAWDHQSLLS